MKISWTSSFREAFSENMLQKYCYDTDNGLEDLYMQIRIAVKVIYKIGIILENRSSQKSTVMIISVFSTFSVFLRTTWKKKNSAHKEQKRDSCAYSFTYDRIIV